MPDPRRSARELALQALYQHDLGARPPGGGPSTEELEEFIARSARSDSVAAHASRLLRSTLESLPEIDARIESAATNWRLSRIASVDRCVLRLALCELMGGDEVPPKVVINEAIELAKRFSTEQSGAFVNGVLDRMYRDIGDVPATGARARASAISPTGAPEDPSDEDENDAEEVVR